MSILSKRGVKPEMEFRCSRCGDTISGQSVIDGEYLYIVEVNKEEPLKSLFRCECCEDDYREKYGDDE
jgi:hypothetical protein